MLKNRFVKFPQLVLKFLTDFLPLTMGGLEKYPEKSIEPDYILGIKNLTGVKMKILAFHGLLQGRRNR